MNQLILLTAQKQTIMSTQKIAQRLEDIYQGEPWFGESLQAKLNQVTEEGAYKQVVNNKHSIAEILSHMEFWRKSFIQQLKGEDASEYNGNNPGNWPAVEDLRKQGWKNQLASFDKTKQELVSLLKKANETMLSDDLMMNLNGLVDHDVYHTGQIGIVKSMVNAQSN